jgi:hypothetical protein
MKTFLRRFGIFTGYFLAFISLLMALACSYRHASLGLDLEEKSVAKNPTMVLTTFYRLNWPGNGTLLIGGSSNRIPETGHSFQAYDIGGTFNESPHGEIPHFLGFGYTSKVWDDGFGKQHPSEPQLWSKWVSIPAFLPTLFFALPSLHLASLARKSPKP